jgi:hypothetical protein
MLVGGEGKRKLEGEVWTEVWFAGRAGLVAGLLVGLCATPLPKRQVTSATTSPRIAKTKLTTPPHLKNLRVCFCLHCGFTGGVQVGFSYIIILFTSRDSLQIVTEQSPKKIISPPQSAVTS